jgi:transposase-like protein
MSTKTKKSSSTGVRYSDSQKKDVVDFVIQYNSKKGRGGQSAASKKFKVTPLTIAAWIKAAGVTAGAPKPAKAVKVPKAAKKAVKAAKPAKKAGKMGRGSRYTPEKKQEIIDYVIAYNAANGRGGQSKAVAKYKLSAITCASWLKAAGVPSGKGAVKKTKAAKAVKTKVVKAVKATAAPVGLSAKVASLVELNEQVRKAETELEKLYSKHDSLMASIKSWI